MVFISKVLEDVIVELEFTYPWFKGQGYSIALLAPKRKIWLKQESLTASLCAASLPFAALVRMDGMSAFKKEVEKIKTSMGTLYAK